MFITGVVDTGDKLLSGVNDTGKKFIAGVNDLCHGFSVIAGAVDTGEQFIASDNDSGDKFIASDNDTSEQLLPVTRTRTPWRRGAAKDRRKLKGIHRPYLRPPKSATAADGVIGTAMKSCIKNTPHILIRDP
jgi:hypothetical protein